MKKTIGILGGMGPLATCDLFQKIIHVTEAGSDQQHVRVCIDSNTEIADRTEAILHHGKDPLPEMVKSAVTLTNMGADVLIMPCNTAHYFYRQLMPFVDIPFLNMLQETADVISKKKLQKVGLLSTSGTIESGVYAQAFKEKDIEMLIPSRIHQQEITHLIYDGVKAGNTDVSTAGFQKAAEVLLQNGAQVLVLGCTELPVAFQKYGFSYPCVDPTLILASRALQHLGMPVKKEFCY